MLALRIIARDIEVVEPLQPIFGALSRRLLSPQETSQRFHYRERKGRNKNTAETKSSAQRANLSAEKQIQLRKKRETPRDGSFLG